jgi:DNA polymerase
MFFGNVPDTLSQLIRTSFIAEEGKLLYVADFSAIEARVAAFLSDETWRLEVFATHGKIYEASASQMFKVPIEMVTKGSELRQKGKISELALGYQGGTGALDTMGASKMGIPQSEWQGLVDTWRAANPNIVRYWYKLNQAAMKVLQNGGKENVSHGVSFEYKHSNLYMHLPSGRSLCYVNPSIGENKFGKATIAYMGMDQTTKKWCKQDTYGGKLFENLCQAFARDCLAVAMLRLDKEGYDIVFHVHDEVIVEGPDRFPDAALEDMCTIMGRPISWAPGLLLRADGYFTRYYKKD